MTGRALVGLFVAAAALIGCRHENKVFDARVRLLRTDAVRVDERGRPTSVDIDIEWSDCPGEQLENVRGGAAFGACVAKFALGDEVSAKVEHRWDARDRSYRWGILDIGGCARPIDPHDEGSFQVVQQCEDVREHGELVGFKCDRIPHEDLIAKCPWFRLR